MIKKELMALRTLKATPKMMEMARNDTVQQRSYTNHWGGPYAYKGYAYNIFLRCQTLKGYLKVAMFLPALMRKGNDMPVYELFISKKAGQFLTWNCREQKWSEAMADNLPWTKDLGWNWHQGTIWINPEGKQTIKDYLGTQKAGWDGIIEWQRKTREEDIVRRNKRQTDPWDAELKQTPRLPKDWKQWLSRTGVPEHFIFYDYIKAGAKEGFCSRCETVVPIDKPGHNKKTVCPHCGCEAVFKSWGKQKYLHTKQYIVYLIQRTKNGLVVREFGAKCAYRQDEGWKQHLYDHELRRAFFDKSAKMVSAYRWDQYKNREYRFIATGNCCASWGGADPGYVYMKNIPNLAKNELKMTGLLEYLQDHPRIDAEWYLAVYNYYPQVETLVKAGLTTLVEDCLHNRSLFDEVCGKKGGDLCKRMHLDAQRLKRLRENNGGITFWRWLNYEKNHEKTFQDEMIRYYCENNIAPNAFGFIRDRMTDMQIYNYIRKQCSLSNMRPGEIITTWKDYLNMAPKFGLKADNPYVYRAAKLKQRHDELVVRGMMKDLQKAADKTAKDYPHVEGILQEIHDIYSYQGEEYTVIVPQGILDIMVEGKALSHCVGTATRYLDRIERRESYIMFLRKTAAPLQSYYTLEVEPGGTIRQKRTTGDDQEEDIEDAKKFLKKWQKEISARLTQQELSLAGKSKKLRLEGFAQMRRDKVRIYTGHLQGHMLVDVLMADLMENEEEKTA